MRKFFLFLTYITGVSAFCICPFSLLWSLLLYAVCIGGAVVTIFLDRKEDQQSTDALLGTICAQSNQLYTSEKGAITYEIKQTFIIIHVHKQGYDAPILSLTYDKKTGGISVRNQDEFVTDEHVDQFKQWLLRKEKTTPTSQPFRTNDAFLVRLQKVEVFCKQLLQEETDLAIETVHLLEQNMPRDVERIKQMYLASKDKTNESLFLEMIEWLEQTLCSIEDELRMKNENELEKLHTLFVQRYKRM